MRLTTDGNLKLRFGIGQSVSTMHRVGSTTERKALWDVCCMGRIVELDLREGHAYYRTDYPRVHWHPEYEVHEGDSAALAVHRLNRVALGVGGPPLRSAS